MKTLMLTTAVCLLATSTMAGGLDAYQQKAATKPAVTKNKTTTEGYALDHPFWGPAQGQFFSDTQGYFGRTNYKHFQNDYEKGIIETIGYGITDNWTFLVDLGKAWGKNNWFGGSDHDKANMWGVSTTYNLINNGRAFTQIGANYGQTLWNDGTGMDKEYGFTAKTGYVFGKFTPFIEGFWGNTLNRGSDNDSAYGAKVAAFTELTKKIGSTLGVRYTHPTSDTVKNVYTLEGDVSYALTKNVALTCYADWLIHQKEKDTAWNKTQEDYTVGAKLRVAF